MSRVNKFSVLQKQIEQGYEVQKGRYEATHNPYYQGQMMALKNLKELCNQLTLKNGKTTSLTKK